MEQTPKKIYENYKNKDLDKNTAIEHLVAIIEDSDNIKNRVESIETLKKIDVKDERVFQLLENLLLSDSIEKIRIAAAEVISKNYIEKALKPMKWVLKHEESPNCLNIIYNTLIIFIKQLEKLEDINLNNIIIDELKEIEQKDFKICLNEIIKEKGIDNYSVKELIEILINYFTISYLERAYWRLNYKIESCRVVKLDFIFKGITYLPEGIKHLSYLKKLILRYNQIFNLPEWIGSLSSLEILNLNVNNIKELPESMGFLSNLRELYLWKNEISYLPETVTKLTSLEILNLRLNQLKNLPENIGDLSSLKELNLHDNRLTFIPQSVGGLKKLEKLNVSWNELNYISDSIGSLSSLKILDLGRNSLNSIPASIGSLHSLEVLNLSENELQNIPEEIGSLKSLQILNLSRNDLTSLPKSLGNLRSLKELYIGDNRLKQHYSLLKELEKNKVQIYY